MMNINDYSISVVVPVYNETENLLPLITEIQNTLAQQYTYEMIYVDDGSTDNSYETLQKLSQHYPQLRFVKHKKNYGQSTSLVSGIRKAKYDWIITLDGDGQNNPADIPLLLKVLSEQQVQSQQPIVVVGNRRKRNDNWFRRLSSRVGNGVRGWLLKDNCPDTGCSLKLFPRDAFLQLPHFNHLHRFLPALFKRAGYTVINVPVDHRPRTRGVSKYGLMNRLWVGIMDLVGVMWLNRRPCHPELENE